MFFTIPDFCYELHLWWLKRIRSCSNQLTLLSVCIRQCRPGSHLNIRLPYWISWILIFSPKKNKTIQNKTLYLMELQLPGISREWPWWTQPLNSVQHVCKNPRIVCMSENASGSPMTATISQLKPEHWGEHNWQFQSFNSNTVRQVTKKANHIS